MNLRNSGVLGVFLASFILMHGGALPGVQAATLGEWLADPEKAWSEMWGEGGSDTEPTNTEFPDDDPPIEQHGLDADYDDNAPLDSGRVFMASELLDADHDDNTPLSSYDFLLFEYEALLGDYDELNMKYDKLLESRQEWMDAYDVLRENFDRINESRNEWMDAYDEQKDVLTKDWIEIEARTNPVIRGIIDGEIKVYFAPLPPYAGEEARDAVDDVIDVLVTHETFGGAPLVITENENNADIEIHWIKNYKEHLGISIFKSYNLIGLGGDECGDWQPFDRGTLVQILWHEIGHSLGYGHSDDPDNIMYPTMLTTFMQTKEYTKLLPAGWRHYTPNCHDGNFWYKISGLSDSDSFSVWVIPNHMNSTEFFKNRDTAFHYESCGELGSFKMISRNCKLPDDTRGKLVVYNHNDNAIKFTVLMKDERDIPWPDMGWDDEQYGYDMDRLLAIWQLYHG